MKNEFDFGKFDCFDKHKMNEEIQEKIKGISSWKTRVRHIQF